MEGPEFDGKVALVTAAAGDGAGQAIAYRLARGGASIVLTDKHEGRLRSAEQRFIGEFGDRVLAVQFDVADFARADAVFRASEDRFGPLDILVNNAASNVQGPIFDYDRELFEDILRVNLTAAWYCAMLAGRQMRRSGGGVIINVGSIAADRGSAAYEPAYAMGKAGLHSLTGGLAKGGGPDNIRCNEVTMGIVAGTRFITQRPELTDEFLPQVPLGRFPEPDDIAEAVAFLASSRANCISGDILNVSSGFFFRN